MTPDPSTQIVVAGQGRTGQRNLNLGSLLAVPLLAMVSGLLVRSGLAGDSLCILALLPPLVGFLVWAVLGEARTVELRDGHLLTARTWSGRRTVDLAQLTKVRRIELRGRGRPTDQLSLKDIYGVRLLLDDEHDAAIREAIEQVPAGQVDISRRAAERLQLVPPRAPAWRKSILVVLRTFILANTILVSGFIPLVISLSIAGET